MRVSVLSQKFAAAVTVAAGSGLLLGPAVLAFFSGGYFDVARGWAALAACGLVVIAALAAPAPRPGPGWIAAAGLAGLCGWTAWSVGRAPLAGPALADTERVALYLAALVASLLLLGALSRAVEPLLALGCTVVVGYGLAGRLVPGIVELSSGRTAFGRLEQPLTYWNAMGALAAMGLVLALRLAGDASRPTALRAGAGAAGVLLTTGAVLTFSRGALAALALGVALLCLLAPERAQLRALATVGGCGLAAALAAVIAPAVRTLEGSDDTRRLQGVAVGLGLLGAMALAARLASRPPAAGRAARPWSAALAVGLASIVVLGGLALTGERDGAPATGATPERLASLGSNRYGYWEVAARMAARHPLRGEGPGAFRVRWRAEREIPERVVDAHSLYLETLAELGLAGLALLGVFVGGVALAAVRAHRRAPAVAAGPIAALVVWAAHAGIDWDWEMPALTLVALALAGALGAQGAGTAGESPA